MEQYFFSAVVPGQWKNVYPLNCGAENCAPEHTYGPAVRDHYLVHFIHEGEGDFCFPGGQEHLRCGDLFLIRPGEVTTYRADRSNPWKYTWIEFFTDAEFPIFSKSVFRQPPVRQIFDSIREYGELEGTEGLIFSRTYELLWKLSLLEEKPSRISENLAVFARAYVEANYMKPLRVQEIADQLHIDRHYLTRLFRAEYGCSPQEFLTELRMERSREFLREGFSVTQAAAMSGSGDLANFSRRYKAYFGVSPIRDKQIRTG